MHRAGDRRRGEQRHMATDPPPPPPSLPCRSLPPIPTPTPGRLWLRSPHAPHLHLKTRVAPTMRGPCHCRQRSRGVEGQGGSHTLTSNNLNHLIHNALSGPIYMMSNPLGERLIHHITLLAAPPPFFVCLFCHGCCAKRNWLHKKLQTA